MDFLFSESSPQTVSFAQPEWEDTQTHQTLCLWVVGTLQPALGEEVLRVLEIFLRHGQSIIAKKDKRLKKRYSVNVWNGLLVSEMCNWQHTNNIYNNNKCIERLLLYLKIPICQSSGSYEMNVSIRERKVFMSNGFFFNTVHPIGEILLLYDVRK